MGVASGCGEQEVGVASGCGEQDAGVASGSGWNLWVWLLGRHQHIMLANLPIMLCSSARKRYLLCSTFVPIMLNFFQLCSSKYS